MNDETRYCFATGPGACMWHGPIQLAGRKDAAGGDELENRCCPKCGADLESVPNESNFWARIRMSEDPDFHEAEAMLRWSQGKCFESFDTLVNAYRQAMEGQQ